MHRRFSRLAVAVTAVAVVAIAGAATYAVADIGGGGVINGCCREMLGWDVPKTLAKTDAIYDTLLTIFAMADREKIPTYQAADRLAEERWRPIHAE